MSEACPNCGKPCTTMASYGAWPRCQHRVDGRTFDPNAQCIFKNTHKGCHKAENLDGTDFWTCR